MSLHAFQSSEYLQSRAITQLVKGRWVREFKFQYVWTTFMGAKLEAPQPLSVIPLTNNLKKSQVYSTEHS